MSTLNDLSNTVNKNVLTPISRMIPGDIRGRMPAGMQGLTSNLTSSAVTLGKFVIGAAIGVGLGIAAAPGPAMVLFGSIFAALIPGFGNSSGGSGGLPATR